MVILPGCRFKSIQPSTCSCPSPVPECHHGFSTRVTVGLKCQPTTPPHSKRRGSFERWNNLHLRVPPSLCTRNKSLPWMQTLSYPLRSAQKHDIVSGVLE